MNLKLVTAPLGEPVNLSEIKEHIRGITGTHEDSYLEALITSSTKEIENLLRRSLLTQTWEMFLDLAPKNISIEIPFPPLVTISSIKTYDKNDLATVFAASNYFVDINSEPGRVSLNDGASWPDTTLRPINGFQVTFVSGYGGKTDVPQQIRGAIRMMVAGHYHNRQNTNKNVGQGMIDSAFHMVMPYRIFGR